MTRRDEPTVENAGRETTRRGALKLGGGAALAMLAATGRGNVMAAQESSPEATPAAGDGQEGRYIVIRSRKIKPDRSAAELIALIREGFVPLVRAVPGFVSYVVVANPDTCDQASIGVFADKAGADESTRLAAEWGQLGAADFVEGDPTVVEGTIDIAAEAGS